jgi:hypothetical protein
VKPEREDAELLLKLFDMYFSGPVREGRKWLRGLPEGLRLKGLLARHPQGSEGYEHFITIMSFWETVGSLMKRGIISQELAFDTFLDGPPWGKVKKIVNDIRKERKNPLEGENLEWVAARARAWQKRRTNQMK